MRLIIDTLPSKKRTPTEEELQIIKRALVSYNIVLGQYQKYADEQKRKDLERLQAKEKKDINSLNPFNTDLSDDKTYEPTLDEVKTFVYSSWAEAVANVKTPLVCDGSKKKGIKRQVFRDIKNGKYLTKKVRETMDEFILKLS